MDDLQVVLPVYNEANSIIFVLKEWHQALSALNIKYKFIIVEDGSVDSTKKLLVSLKRKYPMILDQREERRGYGQAVIDGLNQSRSQFVLCIDSDGSCDPRDFSHFWKNRQKADIVVGRRKKRIDNFYRLAMSKMFKLLFRLFFGSAIADPSSPYVLFNKKKVASFLYELGYLSEGFWWGFSGMCLKHNLIIYQLPINYRPRKSGDTKVYQPRRIPSIAIRNIWGLCRLKFS